ncbi:hypothetical protein ISS03_03275 [Patescibacteria group bacterium]|nr:hypothetical protein [Patescibacteria group bacterium]
MDIVHDNDNRLELEILDTSLRDGTQGDGKFPSVEDALKMIRKMIAVGIDYIEIPSGNKNPLLYGIIEAANEEAFINKIVIFTMTREKEIAPLHNLPIKNVALVCKARLHDVTHSLKKVPNIYLKEVHNHIKKFQDNGVKVFLDLEHAVDAYFGIGAYGKKLKSERDQAENREYLYKMISTAIAAGVFRLVVCDTTGRANPEEITEMFKDITNRFPSATFGFHGHDDRSFANINSQYACFAGARHIQGTFDGLGERVGNLNWILFVSDLQLHSQIQLVPGEELAQFRHMYIEFSQYFDRDPRENSPFVGQNATSSRAGIHISTGEKFPGIYVSFQPEAVGNEERRNVDEQSGTVGIRLGSRDVGTELNPEQITRFMACQRNQALLAAKAFAICKTSLELACIKIKDECDHILTILSYSATIKKKPGGRLSSFCKIKLHINGQAKSSVTTAYGTGIFDAFHKALLTRLKKKYPELSSLELVDHSVKSLGVLEHKSAAMTRVILKFRVGSRIWSVAGVSTSLEEAGLNALIDGIHYCLIMKESNTPTI